MNDEMITPAEALDMYEAGEIEGQDLHDMFPDIFPDYDECDDDE